ncbi:COG4223 family protein [Yoonia vestfoldensis]|nr:hypothetical protein [Yoonia vestfoldensis]
MVKQPAKRPRAAVKPRKASAGEAAPVESAQAVSSGADQVPPEYHASITPDAPSEMEQPQLAPESAVVPPAPKARGGVLAMFVGGLIAGAVGFAVASLTTSTAQMDLQAQLTAQDAHIAAIQQQLNGQQSVDLAPLVDGQAELAVQIMGLQDDLTATVAILKDRITALENRPAGESTGDGAAGDTSEFEADVAALRAELSQLTDMARTQLDTARAEAAAIEQNAAAAARAAAGRAALARLQVGVESGAPLGVALADLEDVLGASAPDALLAVQDGVPTLVALQDSFPDYARAALTTARAEGVAGEDTSGVGAFLRNQFQVRSVNPRDGDDVDAMLSRAQAALRGGLLHDTLAEIVQLPAVARAELSDWLALAEARADAVAAIDMLAKSLSEN